jgi:hypothetical protein
VNRLGGRVVAGETVVLVARPDRALVLFLLLRSLFLLVACRRWIVVHDPIVAIRG